MRITREMELENQCAALEDRVNLAYRQRNNAAIAMVKMAIMLGWPAGRGIDGKVDNDIDWRHVVYIDLPNGEQVSYHMAPDDVIHLEGLPAYAGKWDGKYTGTMTWHSMLEVPGSKGGSDGDSLDIERDAALALKGFAYKRWLVEHARLKADKDVSESDAHRILRGYIRAWSR